MVSGGAEPYLVVWRFLEVSILGPSRQNDETIVSAQLSKNLG